MPLQFDRQTSLRFVEMRKIDANVDPRLHPEESQKKKKRKSADGVVVVLPKKSRVLSKETIDSDMEE